MGYACLEASERGVSVLKTSLRVTGIDHVVLHVGDLEPTDIRGALDFGARAALFAGDNERFIGATQADYTFTTWEEFVHRLPEFC